MSTESEKRKATPLFSGCLTYFPLALAAIARVSKAGNDKHNPGQPLHWSREKSNDHLDCAARHLSTFHTFDAEVGEIHGAEGAWRMLAELELAEEKRLGTNTTVVDKSPPEGYVPRGHTPPVVPAIKPDTKIGIARETPTVVAKNHRTEVVNEPAMVPPPLPAFDPVTRPWPSTGFRYEVIKRPTTFWYLATPYTRFPAGHTAAFLLASRLSALLMSKGVPVFSLIAHSHPIADFLAPHDRINHELWMKMDGPLMAAASGMIVVTAESWEQSKGMAEEIRRFKEAGKPVYYWAPDCSIPPAVLRG